MKRKLLVAWGLWIVTRLVLACVVTGWKPVHDVLLYRNYAYALLGGQVPYVDFVTEYPPAALLVFLLPALISVEPGLYNGWFFVLCVIAEGLLLAAISVSLKEKNQDELIPNAMISLITINTLLTFIVFQRYDLVPALITAGVLVGCYRGSRILAWGLLGTAFAIKLYPVVLAPLVLLYFIKAGGDGRRIARELAWAAGAAGGAVVLLWGPFWLAAGRDMFDFLAYHGSRGLQVESLYANIIVLAAPVMEVKTVFNYGAWHLDSLAAASLAGISLWVMALALVVIYVLIVRQAQFWSPAEFRRELPALFLLILLTFLLTGKVFSPQFILWVAPFFVLAGRDLSEHRFYSLGGIMLAALTLLVWPFSYNSLIHLKIPGILALTVRNLVLIFLYGYLIRNGLLNSPARKMRDT